MNKLYLILLLALAGAPLAACGDDDEETTEEGGGGMSGRGGGGSEAGTGGGSAGSGGSPAAGAGGSGAAAANIVDTAIAAGDFTMLAAALVTTGLDEALEGEGPFTAFAPTDEAFAAFEAANPGVLESLSTEELAEILRYHVVSGEVPSSALENGQLVETLAGPVVAIDLSGNAPKVNDATVTNADVEASNGVIHVIDTILIPPGDIIEVATAAGNFTALAQALEDADLVETLQGEGPFTVFAPTDGAFEALSAVPTGDALVDVLTYHVLPGIAGPLDLVDNGVLVMVNGVPALITLDGGAKINDANITMTNIVASNGVIHVIDAVIVPPEDDIVETAVAAGDFTSLASALTDAGLVSTLQGEGPFTVFAPTDDAFAALSAVPTGDALEQVLLYHVAEGALGSGNLMSGPLEMVSGDSATIAVGNDGVMIDGANVTTANILTRNGVIHVIDAVIVPE